MKKYLARSTVHVRGSFVWRDRPHAKCLKAKKNTVEVQMLIHAIVYGGLSPGRNCQRRMWLKRSENAPKGKLICNP